MGFTNLNRIEFNIKKDKRQFSYIPKWLQWFFAIVTLAVYAFVFYYFIVSPSSVRWKGLYGETCPKGYSIRGVDLSHYQGDIDWELLKKSSLHGEPLRFAIIKATEGTDFIDECFDYNFNMAHDMGIICGAYHFFLPSESPRLQAEYFMAKVNLSEGDFPPVLDIEHKGQLTAEQVRDAAVEWLQIVEEHYNIKPIIYTNYKFKMKYLNDSVLNTYPYWIAHYYVDSLKYNGPWKLWQYTDNGRVDGIKGTVDFNIYNGSMYDLQKFLIGHREENDFTTLAYSSDF